VDFTVSPLSPIPGTLSSLEDQLPGDAAMVARWATGRTSSKGKPIYLFKYFHGVVEGNPPDGILAAQATALQDYADAMLDELGSTSLKMAGPDGVVPIGGAHASPWVTTRTLKRRGRRPPS
jgi:hypothetical protein